MTEDSLSATLGLGSPSFVTLYVLDVSFGKERDVELLENWRLALAYSMATCLFELLSDYKTDENMCDMYTSVWVAHCSLSPDALLDNGGADLTLGP